MDQRVANEFSQLKYHYPPALESSDELPKNLRKIYSTYEGSTKQDGQKRNLTVSVLFFGTAHAASKVGSRYEARVEVSVEALAEDLIELALNQQQKHSGIVFEAQPHECVLKVVGRQEYLIERKPISQYKVGGEGLYKGGCLCIEKKLTVLCCLPRNEACHLLVNVSITYMCDAQSQAQLVL